MNAGKKVIISEDIKRLLRRGVLVSYSQLIMIQTSNKWRGVGIGAYR
jgi:hypothetical protein